MSDFANLWPLSRTRVGHSDRAIPRDCWSTPDNEWLIQRIRDWRDAKTPWRVCFDGQSFSSVPFRMHNEKYGVAFSEDFRTLPEAVMGLWQAMTDGELDPVGDPLAEVLDR